MTWEEWVKLLQQTYPSEGGTLPNIWSYSRAMRERESDPQLANAEHYLYGRKMVEDDPWNALYGYLKPIGYYTGKKLGVLSGRSPPSLEQMWAGMRGIWDETWE